MNFDTDIVQMSPVYTVLRCRARYRALRHILVVYIERFLILPFPWDEKLIKKRIHKIFKGVQVKSSIVIQDYVTAFLIAIAGN